MSDGSAVATCVLPCVLTRVLQTVGSLVMQCRKEFGNLMGANRDDSPSELWGCVCVCARRRMCGPVLLIRVVAFSRSFKAEFALASRRSLVEGGLQMEVGAAKVWLRGRFLEELHLRLSSCGSI